MTNCCSSVTVQDIETRLVVTTAQHVHCNRDTNHIVFSLYPCDKEIIVSRVSTQYYRTLNEYTRDYLSLPPAQFIVHVRRNGVVALQNVKDPAAWLRIYNGKLLGDVGACVCVCVCVCV